MTIKQYINKHGLQYDCEPGLHRAISVIIAFINDIGKDDETEFSVMIGENSINDLNELFTGFCKENGFPRNTVTYVAVVRAAETMDKLIEMECAM